jgi:hypothetical protein
VKDVPRRALKRALVVDKLDGDPVPCTWRGKESFLFLLQGGVALASETVFPVTTLSVPYHRVRISGAGNTRHVVFDEDADDITFADEASATSLELLVLERQQVAEVIHQKQVEAERAAAEAAGLLDPMGGNPFADALGISTTPTLSTSIEDGLVRRLERLAKLHEDGQLSDAEYTAAKARLLDS